MPEQHTIDLPADPAFGTTLRVWVAESARALGLGEVTIEGLRVVVSELLANAATTRSDRLELALSRTDTGWELVAEGAGNLEDGTPADLPFGRLDLLRGLGTVTVDTDGTLRCGGPPAD